MSGVKDSMVLPTLKNTSKDDIPHPSPEKQKLPSLRGMLAAMTAKVTGSPSSSTTTDNAGEVESLAGSMERLRAQSISEEQHFRCGLNYKDMSANEHTNYEHTDLEYDTIRAIAMSRLHENNGMFGRNLTENLSYAKDFIALHAKSLINGTKTDPALVSEVLWDLQAEIQVESSKETPGVGYHAEIIEELRYAAESVASMVVDLKALPIDTLDDNVVVGFFKSYAPRFSHTAPTLLKHALVELRQELDTHEEYEKKKEEVRMKARDDFKAAFYKYQDMIKLGKSRRDIMEELKPKETLDLQVDGDNLKESGGSALASKRPPTPSTISCEDDGDVETSTPDMVKRVEQKGGNTKGRKDSGFSRNIDELFSSDIEMEDDAGLDLFCGDPNDSPLKTPSSSPKKHRIVSSTIDRNPSPTKKPKGTRGVARPVKKNKRGAAPNIQDPYDSYTDQDKTPPKKTPTKRTPSGPMNISPASKSKRGVQRLGVWVRD